MQDAPPAPNATLVVCTTCRRAGEVPSGDARPGTAFHAALAAQPLPPGVALRAVECLSVCSNGCAVALTAPGKWSYVYGGLDPVAHLAEVLRGAGLYAAAPDGIVVWRDRPEVFRKQSVARIPPQEFANEP